MEDGNQKKDEEEYKYMSYGVSFGLLFGALISTLLQMRYGVIVFAYVPSICLVLGLVIGVLIDYSKKKN